MYEKEIKQAIRGCIDDLYLHFRDTYRVNGYTYEVWLVEMLDVVQCYCDGWKKAVEEMEDAERELRDCSFDLDEDGNYADSATDYYNQLYWDSKDTAEMYRRETESLLEDLFGKFDEDLHDILTA